jgi:Domain of unknown function (DUF222)/HNH endonuclease
MQNDDDAQLIWLSDDVLESEICGLAARVAAAMCRFLVAVAEFDRRQGWARWECHDLAGWLSWKCGISPVTAREYGRVAQALAGLPLVAERFAAGGLSYSQVRAITRCATAETEVALVELAGVSTAAQLEAICRAYRRSSPAAEDQAERNDARRCLRFAYNEEGCLVGSFCLPAEAGAVLESVIAAAVDRDAIATADADGARDPFSAVQADRLVELLAAGHQALADGSVDDEDTRFLVTVVTERSALSPPAGDSSEVGECRIVEGPALAGSTARRMACDATVVAVTEDGEGGVLDAGRRTRVIGRRLRRALRRRDPHCRFPGCQHRRVQGHHVWHWADGGPTSLDNLVHLCPRHHRRLHEGGYQLRRRPDGPLEFIHPQGWVIPQICPPPQPGLSQLEWPDPPTYHSGWDGTRLDLPTIIEGLLHLDHTAATST